MNTFFLLSPKISPLIEKRNKANPGPRLSPGGLRPQHPQKGRKEGRQHLAHGTRAATRAGTSNCAPGQQQTSVHQQDSRMSNRSPNQKDIAGKNRTHSSTNRTGTSGQEAERIQEPRHAETADSRRVKGVRMQRLAHQHGSDSVTRRKIQEIKPQIRRIQASRRGSLAAEQEMPDAAPATFYQGAPPSSGRVMQTWQLGR
jgi:hypothetical protein